MNNDSEVMLMALSKERDLLHEQLMQVDRIIKKIKTGEYLSSDNVTQIQLLPAKQIEPKPFPMHANLKLQVLRVFGMINRAAKLKEIQKEYQKLTGFNYELRDTVRSLHQSQLLYAIREKGAQRSILWVKKEWVENGVLLDAYKPDGFDLLYRPENLEYC